MQTYTVPTGRTSIWWASVAMLWLMPAGVSAWTETQIVAVSARVDARAARAHVALDLGLQVRDGWLSRFDLLDLGPDLTLDEPAELEFVGRDGSVYTPSVQVLPGNGLSLQFPDKRSAPKRGEYSLQLRWHTRLTDAGATDRLWSLPRWPERVPNVRVEVLAPLGARPLTPRARPHDGVEFRDLPEQRMSVLRYVRAELPRTTRLDVAWSLPATVQRAAAASKFWPALAQRPLAWWLGACLSLLWLLEWTLRARGSVAAGAADESARGADARTLWRAVGSAIGCGLAVALFEAMPLWAAALGLASCLWASQRRSRTPSAAHAGGPDAGYPRRDPYGCALLDVTTPVGAGLALVICAVLCWLRPLAPSTVACSACLTATLLLLGTRSSRGGRGTFETPLQPPRAFRPSSSGARRQGYPGL
jgi:hypothetical protein